MKPTAGSRLGRCGNRAAVIGALLALIAAAAEADEPASAAQLDRLARESAGRWQASAHGPMLERLLPQRVLPSQLPEPGSEGARLTGRYCVQCHHLPSPAMHEAARWPRVVQRMLPRMQGRGNLGAPMAELMHAGGAAAGATVPDERQVDVIIAYLQRHALTPAPPSLSAALATPAGRVFEAACGQCHALPDPARHRADQWPRVVRRMQENMQWMNRIASRGADPREPRLEPAQITGFLQAHARR